MPQLCNCGTQFTVDHAMICQMGGFPMIRHNDITTSLLTEVCHNVATEPALQPLTEERMPSEGRGLLSSLGFLPKRIFQLFL